MQIILEVLRRSGSLRTAVDVAKVLTDQQRQLALDLAADDPGHRELLSNAFAIAPAPDQCDANRKNDDLSLAADVAEGAVYSRTYLDLRACLDSKEWNELNAMLVERRTARALGALDRLEEALITSVGIELVQPRDTIGALGPAPV
jgi:hypothetical protein